MSDVPTPGEAEQAAYPRWLSDAIQLAPVGIFVTDAAGECLLVNQRWSAITGLPAEAARGRGWTAILHDGDADAVVADWLDAVRGGRAVTREFRLRQADGARRWVHVFSVPIFRPDGGLIGFVGILADVSEAREVERTYRTLVEHSLQGYLVYQDGRAVFANPAFSEITGYERDEVLSPNSNVGLRALHPDDRARVVEHAVRYLSAEPVSPRLSTRIVRKDGAERWLEAFMSRIEYHGRPALQVVYVDHTERHQMERGLQHLNAELEGRVRERTAQLEGALHELESFSYSVSHDLRAPLRAIDGFSQALLEDYGALLDARGRGYLDRVRHGARRMGELIDDLLTLARVMRTELSRETVDLSGLAREVVDELRRAQPGHTPSVTIGSGLVASGDPTLLRSLLGNLIGNAWKFSGTRAAPQIEFGAAAGQPPVYFVRDNGVGFDMTYADKLFGPFSRLHNPDEFEGTGIGLATVHRIVARHGGRVWAESAPEQGATFYFTLG
ncbi:MAG: PAS domain S-box protein [Deltaproteobacteria bacterium]|nr:PAS domain S-box protein [Deltaproteobacteria bacterium]